MGKVHHRMENKPYDILVVGELNADLILSGDVEPAFGQVEKLVDKADLTIGSSAGIFACGAARLGLRVAFTGLVGEDTFGHFMLDAISRRGVDTRGVRIDPTVSTGLSVILNRGSDRAILTYPGSIPLLRYADIDLDLLSKARHLHLGSYFMLDELRPEVPRLFAEAHRRGLTTSLDTNYDPSLAWDGGIRAALAQTDLFFPNETELLAISRAPDLLSGMQAIADLGPGVIVKRGVQGASGLWHGEYREASAIPVQVADTVGAGDSFDAGFLAGTLRPDPGWNFETCLKLGCICGALSTRQPGGTEAQPTLDEARNFLTQADEPEMGG
jgi:sugar/nucleoside kinase (ribokinase family)